MFLNTLGSEWHINKLIIMHIALYKPDIPQNTAAIIRLGACLNLKIHIIEPCGFNLNDARFKQAPNLMIAAVFWGISGL